MTSPSTTGLTTPMTASTTTSSAMVSALIRTTAGVFIRVVLGTLRTAYGRTAKHNNTSNSVRGVFYSTRARAPLDCLEEADSRLQKSHHYRNQA